MAKRDEREDLFLSDAFSQFASWFLKHNTDYPYNEYEPLIRRNSWPGVMLRQCLDPTYLSTDFLDMFRRDIMIQYETIMNDRLSTLIALQHPDFEDYEGKLELVKALNYELRILKAAIAHPETGEPSILFAIASRDGEGRYTLENRITKKRSGHYKSLSEILPLKLVPDVPRKKKGDNSAE